MRRLKGAIPRGTKDHRTSEGILYRESVRAIQERYRLDRAARPLLREYGLLCVDLERLAEQIEVARTRTNRPIDLRRLLRQQRIARSQLLGIERRLEELAGTARRNSPDHLGNLLGDLHGE